MLHRHSVTCLASIFGLRRSSFHTIILEIITLALEVRSIYSPNLPALLTINSGSSFGMLFVPAWIITFFGFLFNEGLT